MLFVCGTDWNNITETNEDAKNDDDEVGCVNFYVRLLLGVCVCLGATPKAPHILPRRTNNTTRVQ